MFRRKKSRYKKGWKSRVSNDTHLEFFSVSHGDITSRIVKYCYCGRAIDCSKLLFYDQVGKTFILQWYGFWLILIHSDLRDIFFKKNPKDMSLNWRTERQITITTVRVKWLKFGSLLTIVTVFKQLQFKFIFEFN